jgi:hypothetical protein
MRCPRASGNFHLKKIIDWLLKFAPHFYHMVVKLKYYRFFKFIYALGISTAIDGKIEEIAKKLFAGPIHKLRFGHSIFILLTFIFSK